MRSNAMQRGVLTLAGVVSALAAGAAVAQMATGATETSPRVDAIRKAGALRVGVLANAPWLIENMSGQGEAWSGPAWILAQEYARRLKVKLEPIPVSHETKVPVLASNQVDISITPLAETPERLKVVDFIIYSNTSVCMFGLSSNPKFSAAKSVDDLNKPGVTIAYYTGGGEGGWVKERFRKAQLRGVAVAGAAPTVAASVGSSLTRIVSGCGGAILRLYGPRWLKPVVVLYIDYMRAIPVLVVIVWTFFALPIAAGLTMPPFAAALLALTIHLAAYAAEIVRAGIESVRPGQTRAALTLGMSRRQVLRRIILPQASVRMLPAFGSLLSITIKDTAIASVIAVPELMRQSETLAGQSFQPLEVYTFAMLVYFVLLFPVTRGVDRFYRSVAHLGRS